MYNSAYQLPHCFWFFTGVTAFFLVQSVLLGSPSTDSTSKVPFRLREDRAKPAECPLKPLKRARNSALVMSAKSFTPTVKVFRPARYSRLCFRMNSRLLAKTLFR